MITFANLDQVVRIARNPSQRSRWHKENLDGKTLNHRSGVHFGIPGSLASYVFGSLEIEMITKSEADALYAFFIGCMKRDLPFSIASDMNYNFGASAGVTITGCYLQNFRSLDGMIRPRAGRMRYDFRLDYISGLQSTLVSGTGVVSVGAGSEVETTYTDPRDGTVYQLIQNNGLLWFAKNFEYNDGSGVYYGNNPIYASYGRLYFHTNAVSYAPSGWRLPTKAEAQALEASYTLDQLRSTSTWTAGNGNNESGFNLLASGEYYAGIFYNLGLNGGFWTSDTSGANDVVFWASSTTVNYSNIPFGVGAYSVRYVKDT